VCTFLVSVVCCAGSGLYDELITRSEKSCLELLRHIKERKFKEAVQFLQTLSIIAEFPYAQVNFLR